MAADPIVTIVSPTAGAIVPRPFTARGLATPQDGYEGPGVVRLYNDVTGELLGTATAPAGGGEWIVEVTGGIAGLRSGTASPRAIAKALRAALAQPQKTSTGRRSSIAAPTGATNEAFGRRGGIALPNAKDVARLSGTASGLKKLTARRAGTVTPYEDAPAGGIALRSVGTSSTTPSIPAGAATDDILVMVASLASGSSPSNGWTRKVAGASAFAVWWHRVAGAVTLPVVGGLKQIAAFSGCVATGDPFEAASAVVANATGADVTAASISTVSPGAMVLFAQGASAYDEYGEQVLTFSDPTTGAARSRAFASVAPTYDYSEGLGLWYDIKATAGATGTETTNSTISGMDGTNAAVLLALTPA